MAKQPIVDIVGLRKVYGSTVAVDGIEMRIDSAGSVHGFLGPNGSGKTTTIRCLLSLVRPTQGKLMLFGHDVATEMPQVVDRVGAIVEAPKLFPKFSGRRNLELLARLVGIGAERVDEVLEQVGLADRQQDTFESYSLGMKQRLAIAAALLKRPDLLILDEPANGLDPAGIAEIRTLIRSVADQGATVLVSSHQLAEIEQVCDQVTIIANGKVLRSGSMTEVRAEAGSTSVAIGLADLDTGVEVLNRSGHKAIINPSGDGILVIDPPTDHSALTKILADNSLYVSSLVATAPTLESAFLKITGAEPPPPTPPPKPRAATTEGASQ